MIWAENFNPNCNCNGQSTPYQVNPGDEIQGEIGQTCDVGTTQSCPTWNIYISDLTNRNGSALLGSPSNGQIYNWAFAGALEAYGINTCSDLPSNNAITFYNEYWYDWQWFEMTPVWSKQYLPPTQQLNCGWNVTIGSVNPNNITLEWNSTN